MIQFHNVTKQFGSKVLFSEASARIGIRSRIALTGPNGAGKSTLIRLILGEETPDEGEVLRDSDLSIGYLPQEVPKMSGRTVLEEVLRLDGRRESLIRIKSELEKKFEDSASDEELSRYGRIQEELEHLDEYRLESRAKSILSGMGFKPEDGTRNLTEFSGGWLMRVALSRILLLDPDLLLLDEPTNHLDLESLLWLEGFLKRTQGALLIISHDASFLNPLVNEVFEIDQKKIWTYTGNLSAARKQKEDRLKLLQAQYQAQQSKIQDIHEFVDRFGAKATKARQAQSRLKQLEKMDLIELPDQAASVRFRFPEVPHSGKEIIHFENTSLKFGSRQLFNDLNFMIKRNTRTAIVGVNGAGKTTLLRMMAGHLEPSAGRVRLGHEVKVGYYSQHQAETLNMKASITEELEATAPLLPIAQIRAIAGAFLFSGESVFKKCGVLSGGEKARVALAKLLLTPSNFLLLDEPTNHLDAASKEVLLNALLDYEGTLCIVSHDRDFIGPLANNLLEISPSGESSQVHNLVQSYADYISRKVGELDQEFSKESIRSHIEAPKVQNTKSQSKRSVSNNQRSAWEREHSLLEAKIAQLESESQSLNQKITDPVFYNDKTKLLELLNTQQKLTAELEKSYQRWEELSALVES